MSRASLKHRLFAWHEASFYGTELAIQAVQEIELIVLPAEEVIPFFPRCIASYILNGSGANDAATADPLAPVLDPP